MIEPQSLPDDNTAILASSDQAVNETVRNPIFACDLGALTRDQRTRHHLNTTYLLTEAVQEIQALPGGYAFRFSANAYAAVAEFVAMERLCCPFVTFIMEVRPDRGPIWLQMTGPEGVKAFLRLELNLGAA